MRRLDRTDASLAFLVLMWGSAFPGIKVLGEVLDPFQITWYRYVPFLAIYGIGLAWGRRATFGEVTGRDWILLGIAGGFGVIGYHFALNWGLHATGAGVPVTAATGAILVATGPLWTMLIARLAGQERLSAVALAGSAVAFAGVVVVVFLGRGEADLAFVRKALVVVVAPISWSVYTVLTKPLVGRYGGLFVTGTSLSIGTLALLPLGLWYGWEPLSGLEARHWAWLGFLAILSTALGYAIWNQAIKRRTASQVSAYIYFNPVVATAVAWLVLGERVTGWFLAGSLLVLVGVVIVNQARLATGAPPAAPPAPPGAGAKS